MTLPQGTRLGPYEIVAPLGSGGMGEVYRAHDARLRRDVAIKVLPGKFSDDPERLRRLQQEAQAAGALNHPNILTIYDIGTHEGVAYIVSELLEGRTLRALLAAGPVPPRRALDIALQIARGLDAAHARGIVHRDLKPENLFVTQDDRVKILDFGLAKLRDETVAGAAAPSAEEITSLPTRHQGTAPGVVLGTLGYMSPEQVRGQPTDGRSDIFSFGAILYELLSGRRAFQRDTPADTISAILTGEPADPAPVPGRGVPPGLDRILRHCLEKDPARRFQSAHDLAFDLETMSGGHTAGGASPAQPEWAAASRRLSFWGAAGAAVVTALVAGAYFVGRPPGAGAAIDSIAVLPFVNAGQDPEMEYLSDGITESLIHSLSKLPHLRVMSRNSVFHYKGKEVDAREAGAALGVKAVLTGRVMERGETLSINAELVDVRDNSHLWGAQYGGKSSDVLSVQQEIARQISDNLRVRLTGDEKSRLAKRPTESNEAYQLYLKGRFFWNQRGQGLLKATEYFDQALNLDPNYAQAHAGSADALTVLAFYGFRPAREAFPKAKARAERALAIEPSLGEAHATLGYIAFHYDWDLGAAEREYLRGIELAPNHPPAHYWYAIMLSTKGDWDGATAEMEKAMSLDPLSPFVNIQAGWLHLRRGAFDEAVDGIRKGMELNPSIVIGHLLLGHVQTLRGRFEEGIAEMSEALRLSDGDAWVKGSLAYAFAASGEGKRARTLLEELLEGPTPAGFRRSYPIALAYAGLGDRDRAFTFLDKSREERDPMVSVVRTDHLLDGLHSDPRWLPYLRSLGLLSDSELAKIR